MLVFTRLIGSFGRLAQLVEHLVYTEETASKSTVNGPSLDEQTVTLWRTNRVLRTIRGPTLVPPNALSVDRRLCEAKIPMV